MVTNEAFPDQLIAQARGGDSAALGRLLELYRNYLRLVARSLIGVALRVKAEPSDLVQETFLKAHREFAGFAGQGEPELDRLATAHPGADARRPRQAPPPQGARPPAARVAGPAPRTLGRRGPAEPRLPRVISQQRCRAARAGGPAGRRRRSSASRLPRGVHPPYVGAHSVRGDRGTDGSLDRRGADALDPALERLNKMLETPA